MMWLSDGLYRPRNNRIDPVRADLQPPERAWLDHRQQQAEREAAQTAQERPRRMPGRISRACDKWSVDAGWVAAGLERATVTVSSSSPEGGRRGSGPSDPTGAALYSTMAQVEQAAVQFAHLAGPCRLDGTRSHDRCCGTVEQDGCNGILHECPDVNAVRIASWLDLDLDHTGVVDDLLGTSPSSPATFAAAVSALSAWHTLTASRMAGAWREAWQAGVGTSELDTVATGVEELQRRMSGLAGSLAGWSGRTERMCKCGGGVKDQEGTCGKCRTASWRERQGA